LNACATAAKLPTVLSDTERLLHSIVDLDSLEVLGKVLYNAAVSPNEDKYRRLRLSNAKVAAAVVEVPGALDLMLALGWVKDEQEDALMLPAGACIVAVATEAH
jgi:hypothetical protein